MVFLFCVNSSPHHPDMCSGKPCLRYNTSIVFHISKYWRHSVSSAPISHESKLKQKLPAGYSFLIPSIEYELDLSYCCFPVIFDNSCKTSRITIIKDVLAAIELFPVAINSFSYVYQVHVLPCTLTGNKYAYSFRNEISQ